MLVAAAVGCVGADGCVWEEEVTEGIIGIEAEPVRVCVCVLYNMCK